MRRNPATLPWFQLISVSVLLAVGGACSSPNREVASAAPAAKEPVEPANPAPPEPAPPPAPSNPPPNDSAPTPAETPLPEEPPAPVEAEAKPTPEDPGADALKWMEDREAKRAEYQKNLEKLAADRDAAKAVLANAERDLLAFRNPYLARPKLTPAESGEVQGMNGPDRVKWAESRVADAISTLESAQKAYDDAKANPPPD